MLQCDVLEDGDLLRRAPSLDDPYPVYAAIRRRAEWLVRDEASDCLVVARAAAVDAVLQDPAFATPPAADVLAAPVGADLLDGFYAKLVRWREDPRAQAVRRRLVFPLREATGLRGRQRIAAVADRLGEPLSAQPSAEAVETFCRRLPTAALTHLMGVPGAEAAALAEPIARLCAPLSPHAPAQPIEALERSYETLTGVLSHHIGFLDDDVGAAAPGVGADDLLANLVGLCLQAQEATEGLTLNCLAHHLAGRADGVDLLQFDARSAFVEETDRFDPAIQLTRRIARDGAALRGVPVPEGATVIVALAAANRDPEANPEPDRFDLYRTARRSFAFSGGRHACPGRRLAAAIAEIGFMTILTRCPGVAERIALGGYRPSHNARLPSFEDFA